MDRVYEIFADIEREFRSGKPALEQAEMAIKGLREIVQEVKRAGWGVSHAGS